MDLSDRKQKILQAIIDEYIGTAEPVGSRAISKRNELGLSSATIRNEMADLEDMGYLVKPHTSAGRIPSDIGYRFYVNSLMQRYQISVEAVERLKEELFNRVNQLDVLIKKAGVMASVLTEYTTVFTAPSLGRSVIRKLDIISMSGANSLLLLVTKAGLVKNKMIDAAVDDYEAAELTAAINRVLSGKTCDEITESDFEEICELALRETDIDERKISLVIGYVAEWIRTLGESEVFVNNSRAILQYPEFSNVGKAREMLDFLEDKDNLIKIMESGHNTEGVGIKIGAENDFKELENTSLVTVDYKIGDRTLGQIAVIGPKRMNYAKVIASLDLISTQIDSILKQFTEGEG
ncbi:MAG: heat-inducible transcription repressor HrcA [Clostridia bacterium]|nr:heat-inducible transcription repressor HrcA [Clostridia bacterium]